MRETKRNDHIVDQVGLLSDWNPLIFGNQLGVLMTCDGNPDDAAVVANIGCDGDI